MTFQNTQPDKIDDERWESALERRRVIERWLEIASPTKELAADFAAKLNCSVPTFYRWVQNFRKDHQTSSLVVGLNRGNKTKQRLHPDVEKIISDVIKNLYLTKERPIRARVVEEVELQCFKVNLSPPSKPTIYRRIADVPAFIATEHRYSKKKAKHLFEPHKGSATTATRPLEQVQIDHTPTDLTLVDPKEREGIDRAWITSAIDSYSRACMGFYLSFGAPSSLSTALCLTQSVLPKEQLLREHKISGNWSMQGLPEKIFVDNGSDFHSAAFKRGCDQHGISLDYRPKGAPQFGAVIERFIKTLNHRSHNIPGTTFSSSHHRGEYDSQGRACMTLKELEGYLLEFIVNVYNQRLHQGIGMPPAAKFEQGFGGNDPRSIVRRPRLPSNQKTFLIDFLPVMTRTVQRYGVRVDGINYYSDILGQILFDGDKRKFELRRDPRDISTLYLYHPEDKTYYELPYRDPSQPPMSIWELRHIKDRMRREGKDQVDEGRIFAGYEAMQNRIAESVASTQKAKKQRRTEKRRMNPHAAQTHAAKPAPAGPRETLSNDDLEFEFDPSMIESEIKIR
ncbi:Mu transposase C-terminal domain-containing protein [Thalassospira sp. MBR-102]|uniref:Mu transposase C-terminal domain-containing protein n=1 Tax=Thalassospira sp. MBR-102 TaxID=3156466 RepID=UPI003392BE07